MILYLSQTIKSMRVLFLSLILLISCSTSKSKKMSNDSISESEMLERNVNNETARLQYKLISSKFNTKKDVWASAQSQA